MITIPTNLTVRNAEPAKDDSRTFPYPIKIISGYHCVQDSATTGLNDRQQAMRFADSFAGTEIMFDIILSGDSRCRVTGHMYHEGSYGEFIFMHYGGIFFYQKTNGVWSERSL